MLLAADLLRSRLHFTFSPSREMLPYQPATAAPLRFDLHQVPICYFRGPRQEETRKGVIDGKGRVRTLLLTIWLHPLGMSMICVLRQSCHLPWHAVWVRCGVPGRPKDIRLKVLPQQEPIIKGLDLRPLLVGKSAMIVPSILRESVVCHYA